MGTLIQMTNIWVMCIYVVFKSFCHASKELINEVLIGKYCIDGSAIHTGEIKLN